MSVMYDIGGFFSGKTIFLTGGTGFLGKALLHKLLVGCPDLETVYLLIRPKHNLDIDARLAALKQEAIFDSLLDDEQARVRLRERVHAVEGDVALPHLGLSDADKAMLIAKVHVVLHSAATVRFNEPLNRALKLNVEGTRSLLELAESMDKLQAIVHVSTAYAHCNLGPDEVIKEEFYEAPQLKDLAEWPNTYTFTKALAEQLVLEKQGKLPIGVVRPSIVTAALESPVPGWIDNLNGPTGMILGGATGVLRTFHVSGHKRIDLVPVDSVINIILAVACFVASKSSNTVPIYNFASGPIKPLYWRFIKTWGEIVVWKYPFEQMLWFPEVSFRSIKIVDRVARIFLHFIPALLIDLARVLACYKPKMFRTQMKIANQLLSLEFFANRDFNWKADNVMDLHKLMSKTEKNKMFNFDLSEIDWRSYYEHYFVGIRRYALKQSDDSLKASRFRMNMFYYVHVVLQSLVMVFMAAALAHMFDAFRAA